MIADEVMAGFGRCGEWFAVDHWDVTPDLICFAKGRQLRVRPARRRDHLPNDRRHVQDQRRIPAGSRTPGIRSPARPRCASINIFKEEGIIEHARHSATDVDRAGAAPSWPSTTRRVGEVRGLGVFWAIELGAQPRRPASRCVPYNASGAGGRTDGRAGGGVQSARAVAVHALQPACTSCRRCTTSADDGARRTSPSSTRRSTSPISTA